MDNYKMIKSLLKRLPLVNNGHEEHILLYKITLFFLSKIFRYNQIG